MTVVWSTRSKALLKLMRVVTTEVLRVNAVQEAYEAVRGGNGSSVSLLLPIEAGVEISVGPI